MKKVILSSLMLLVAAMISAATYSWEKVVTVTLTDGNNDTYSSRFGAAPELTDAASWGAVTTNLTEAVTVRAYTTLGGVNYEQLYLNSIENLPLTIKTFNSETMTITLTALYGEIKLYDNGALVLTVKKGSSVESDSYVFSVAENETIEGRFIINYTPYSVTLNDNFLATFSAAENVELPEGLKAYAAEYVSEEGYLNLYPISYYIPANTGVILFNEDGAKALNSQKNFSLAKYTGTDQMPTISVNDLKPASAYATNHTGHIYVLHGDKMYKYVDEASGMKPNKAFLQIDAQYPAPARIAFRFNGEQGIENVAAEGKAVKFVENGRVFIKRGEKVYNLQGQLVK